MGESSRKVLFQVSVDAASLAANDTFITELEAALGSLYVQEDIEKGEGNQSTTKVSDDRDKPLLSTHQNDHNTKGHANLTKCATFPPPGRTQPSTPNVDDDLPGVAMNHQTAARREAACSRSTSMPARMKLVSAMKGGREQQLGAPRLAKMNVTWAPDVYDPPATSLSHTVKNHHQRSKSPRRKDQKHKHKGKSPRASTSEKKKHHANKRSIVPSADFTQSRSQASGGKSLPLNGFDQVAGEVISSVVASDGFVEPQNESVRRMNIAELSVSSQDSKCGSSFRASLAGIHVSIAEATS